METMEPSLATPQTVTEMEQLIAVKGHSAQLPCDVTPPKPGEQVYLVLWYRHDDGGEPIYSYDARNGGPENGQRWSDNERGFGNRARFHWRDGPAYLHIEKIHALEAGVYRCRVDFKTAPTRNSLLNLTVVIPPSKPTIFDETGREVKDLVGPYLEGETIVLKCITSGGDPMPQVTWWRDNHLIDSSFEKTFSKTVQNTLSVPQVTREDLGATLMCQASNNNISAPASTRATIDLKFRPENVRIMSKREPLSTGKDYLLECRSYGSRPPATVTWWKNSKFMNKAESQIIHGGNVTKSTLPFHPRAQDHGKTLTCRAENTELSHAAIEDHWKLTIHYAPMIELSFGSNLNPDNIAEGNDVYFECKIKANPEVYKVVWLHDDVMVLHDKSAGVIISGSSLVLQSVGRKQAGTYTCVASNLEGDTQSNMLELKVMYKPICSNLHRVVQGVGRDRVSRIVCPIDAHPPPLDYAWTFNSSLETHTVPHRDFSANDTHSVLRYKPESDNDFGYLYCWAENVLGKMDAPCAFQLIPAGPPEAPTNCSVVNQTTDSLVVECLPSFDGGLKQFFGLEVTDLQSGALTANFTDALPEFQVSGLNSGRGLKITIYAANANGRSPNIVLEGFTLKVAELQVESPVPLEFTPVLGILIGVVVTLLLVAFVIMLILRLKYKNTSTRSKQQQQNQIQRRGSNSSNNGQKYSRKATDPDDEEYFCLRPTNTTVATEATMVASKPNVVATAAIRNHKVNGGGHPQRPTDIADHNPDVIPGGNSGLMHHVSIHGPECESIRSGTPVKSDISGTGSVSGYGTGGDSGSDKTPPYLPTSKAHNYATLGHPGHHMQQHYASSKGICNPMEAGHVTYAQLTLPSPRREGGHQFNQHHPRDPRFVGDKVIYSQIDMTRKTSLASASAAASSASGGNKGHNHLTVMHGGVARDPTSEDPLSWAPLLGNRNQPESSL